MFRQYNFKSSFKDLCQMKAVPSVLQKNSMCDRDKIINNFFNIQEAICYIKISEGQRTFKGRF
jgi:hypothetical protein